MCIDSSDTTVYPKSAGVNKIRNLETNKGDNLNITKNDHSRRRPLSSITYKL